MSSFARPSSVSARARVRAARRSPRRAGRVGAQRRGLQFTPAARHRRPRPPSAPRRTCRSTTTTRRPRGAHRGRARARGGPGDRIGSLFFNFGGPGGAAVDYSRRSAATGYWRRAQRALRHRRASTRAASAEHARDRLQVEPGEARHLLEALHDARQPRRRRAAAQGQGLHPHLPEAQRRILPVRLDRQRGAGHGRGPRGCSASGS